MTPSRTRTPLLALVLAGGLGLSLASPAPAPAAAPAAAPAPAVAAAAAAAAAEDTLLGFHDQVPGGGVRPIRNDLSGALAGQVEFAQSHTINPSGNAARKMPTLVADRTALLIFTPTAPVTSMSVVASRPGAGAVTLPMNPPALLPADDKSDPHGRPEVAYSTRAWSVELPWDRVTPGMSLSFTDGTRTGTLAASGIEVAAPTELVVNGIQLGMLTDAPVDDATQPMISRAAKAGTDYFATIPVAKLTVASYEPVRLDKVIVASGAIYQVPGTSAGEGGTYSGDMRENVGKAQISTGINLANFGTTSGPMNQSQPGTYNLRTYHHSAGAYTNGRHVHGLSGGNGMMTLYGSTGNEWSHEIGHSYGLGHYPGTDPNATGDAKVINATHHSESGWGYIAHRKRMRSNLISEPFSAAGRDVGGYQFTQNFAGAYNYNVDAMSGGWDDSDLSEYTHHTGYSADIIQRSLTSRTPDLAYPSGYRAWNGTGWVDAKTLDPAFNQPKPAKVGVPVVSLVGGYNPANPAQTVLYPALRSNYGNVFTFAGADTGDSATRRCWMEVGYVGGRLDRIPVQAGDGVKQVNINLEAAAKPSSAAIVCKQGTTQTRLAEITIDTDAPALPAAVTIGKQAGYSALRAVEIPELDAALTARAAQTRPVLDAATQVLVDSWGQSTAGLSATAQQVLERVRDVQADAEEIDAFIAAGEQDILAGSAKTNRLRELMHAAGFVEADGSLLPTGAPVSVDGGAACLDIDAAGAPTAAPRTGGCSGAASWYLDPRGAIHPVSAPQTCLTAATPARLISCDRRSGRQAWTYESSGHLRSEATGQYLARFRENNKPGMWTRTDQPHFVWTGLPRRANPGPAMLSARSLRVIAQVQRDTPAIGGAYTLSGVHNSQLITLAGGSSSNGAAIVQQPATSGVEQRWRLSPSGDGGLRLVNPATGKCLSIPGGSTANGAGAISWTCDGGQHQEWVPRKNASGGYEFLAAHSSKCLGVPGFSGTAGTQLVQWTCDGGANQRWTFAPVT